MLQSQHDCVGKCSNVKKVLVFLQTKSLATGPWGMLKNIFGLSQLSQDEPAWLL